MIVETRKALLTWYYKHHRKLPWRETRDPYAIWVSEVMLQQTQVDTVIPYYKNFLKTFPTLTSLSHAPEETILKAWQGLGYYRRAKHMHDAAKEVVATYGSQLPTTRDELKKLKGFGPYTSASVASIAFGEPVACVDGNVKRVISRLFATHDEAEPYAQRLLATEDPSSFNQAMMELGALICKPKQPNCAGCPVNLYCQAYQTDKVLEFPEIKSKKKPDNLWVHVLILNDQDRYYLEPRANSGRYAGMWQLPTYETVEEHADIQSIWSKNYGVSSPLKKLNHFKHQLTHKTMWVQSYTHNTDSKKISTQEGTWLTRSEIAQKPLPKLYLKVLDRLK